MKSEKAYTPAQLDNADRTMALLATLPENRRSMAITMANAFIAGMEALGVTDLTDPVQCAAVALDYLRELSEGYGFGWITDHDLYMAYNMGPGNARTALNAGTTSSHYSRSVLAAFEECAAEMEAAA